MPVKRILLYFTLLALCSCATTSKPLQPVLKTGVKTIELASTNDNKPLLIRQVYPAFFAMGMSGMMMDAVVMANRADEYEKIAGPVKGISHEAFEQMLIQRLTKQGLNASVSEIRHRNYYYHGENQDRPDGILYIQFRHLGFWSKGVEHPYRPAVLLEAKMIDPKSHKILYSDRFSMGIDAASLKWLGRLYGKINVVSDKNTRISYPNYEALLQNPAQSRYALLNVVLSAAKHIARSIHGDEKMILDAYAKTAAQVRTSNTYDLIVVADSANLHSSHDTGSRVVGQVKRGDIVRRIRQRGDWYSVQLSNGSFAWAYASVFLGRDGLFANDVSPVARNP